MRRTPIDSGGTQVETVTVRNRQRTRTLERREPISTGGSQITTEMESSGPRRRRIVSPVTQGTKAGGIGLLEAEFFGCLGLLVLALFAGPESYANKIMSTMKRGTMIMLLFLILALIAGVGPNAAKISKAIGGLVFFGILLSSPILGFNQQGEATGLLPDLDKFLKADWVGTTEHGTDVGSADQSSADQSSSSQSQGGGGALGAAEGAIQRITGIIQSFGFGIIK